MPTDDPIPPGRILRAVDARTTPLYPPSRLLRSGEAEAARLLAQARAERETAAREAAALVAAATSEADSIRAQAAKEGASEAAGQLSTLLEATRKELSSFRDEAADQIIRLALRLARVVVDAELAKHPERVRELAVKALRHAAFSAHVRVLMHPQDAALIAEHAAGLSREAGFEGDLAVEADDTVPRGGVRVATEMGDYDAGVETQFRELHRALLGEKP